MMDLERVLGAALVNHVGYHAFDKCVNLITNGAPVTTASAALLRTVAHGLRRILGRVPRK